jgi:DNA primase catalytic subunit
MVEEKKSLKEERIRNIALTYYTRQDIRDAMLNFSQNRECTPQYFEGFGKRPDTFQFQTDILELAKKGATSFHCSEELWKDPLEISTDLTEEQLNKLRIGWDLLIDIDCKWFEYSKKAALSIIQALEHNGVKNPGIKFSGSKGFHIIVPWKAFPKIFKGEETKKMFPDWPRAIANYLKDFSRPILKDLIKDTESDFKDMGGFVGVKCNKCNNLTTKGYRITLKCPRCPHLESFISFSEEFKKRQCPQCIGVLEEVNREEFYKCDPCNLNSIDNPSNFNKEIQETDIFKILGLDIVLVSSRHLFRMPYSLHEKTSLASVVIPKQELKDFDIKDAHPLKAKVLNFIPEVEEGEATELLLQALDHKPTEEPEIKYQPKEQFTQQYSGEQKQGQGKSDFKDIVIKDLTPDLYPPTIKVIMSGMKSDGRKRALFILLNFFRSLKLEPEKIQTHIVEWNKKNYEPLKSGYINAQLAWHAKQKKAALPPNFDKPHYKELGFQPTQGELKAKNPVSYVVRKSFALKMSSRSNSKSNPKSKNYQKTRK